MNTQLFIRRPITTTLIMAAILIFVGLKMLLYKWVHLPTGTSLLIISAILAVALVVSLLHPAPPEQES